MDIIAKAKEIGKMIQQEECYKKMMEARKNNDEDKELQQLIGDFNLKRSEISVIAQNKDENTEEKVSKLNEEIKDMYSKIMSNQNMVDFNQSKKEVDELMNKIQQILILSVNGADPETADQDMSSCGGSCSSCSGCH